MVNHMSICVYCCCSVIQSCQTLCDYMDCSMPGFPVLHHILDLVQTHDHWVCDAIQTTHPLSTPFLLPSIFPSIRVISNESALPFRCPKYWSFSSASVLPMNIQSWFPLGLMVGSPCSLRDSQESSPATIWKCQFFSTQPSWSSSHFYTWLLETP